MLFTHHDHTHTFFLVLKIPKTIIKKKNKTTESQCKQSSPCPVYKVESLSYFVVYSRLPLVFSCSGTKKLGNYTLPIKTKIWLKTIIKHTYNKNNKILTIRISFTHWITLPRPSFVEFHNNVRACQVKSLTQQSQY